MKLIERVNNTPLATSAPELIVFDQSYKILAIGPRNIIEMKEHKKTG